MAHTLVTFKKLLKSRHWRAMLAWMGGGAVALYILLADSLIVRLHEREWWQPVTAFLDAASAVLQVPGFAVVHLTGAREGPRTTSAMWWAILIGNAVLYPLGLWLLLHLLFPARLRGTSAESGRPTGRTSDSEAAVADAAPPDRLPRHLMVPRSAQGHVADAADADRAVADATAPGAAPAVTRRGFITSAMRVGAVGGAAVTGYGVFVESRWLHVSRRVHPLRDLPAELDGLRVVQLTDIHHGPNLSLEYVRRAVRTANALDADLMVLTGDFVHRSPVYIEPVARELANLRARVGVVGVLGNHDWWEDGPRSKRAFAAVGIPLLDNDRALVTRDRRLLLPRDGHAAAWRDAGLCVAGIGDFLEDDQDYDRALRGVPADVPRLLLSHNPDAAEDRRLLDAPHRVDLMISGHTHGGQIVLPLIGPPVIPSRYGRKYAGGLIQGPKFPVFVSRGIGTTLLPVRLGASPEIAVIELRRA